MEYLPSLERVTAAFLGALAGASPDASCASIRWSTTQLGAHLGAVHTWVSECARESTRQHRDNVPSIRMPVAEF